ncbi:hypothetical protein MCOR25_009084 [Pyricularia grisea]|nr:hypothetical protein MCOR25_009084 [Pyricularia grisea]
MDGRSSTTAEPKHNYATIPWPNLTTSLPGQHSTSDITSPILQTPIELLLLSQHSVYHQSQLLSYNRLFAPGRAGGGGGGGLQGSPTAPAKSRSRSSSKVSNKDSSSSKSNGNQNCHGNKQSRNTDKADRALIAVKESASPKMPSKEKDASKTPNASSSSNATSAASSNAPSSAPKPTVATNNPPPNKAPAARLPAVQASSVPSTPHQHARNYSFEDREQSPNAIQNHSPRSTYSESNVVPTFRQLPPRLGGCAFETAMIRGRRRIPYSLGDRRLEKVEPSKIKSKLSEDEERRLTTDMRELFDRLKPTEKVKANRDKLIKKLEKMFNDQWPGHSIKVHLFGSSGNKLCSDDSDVDICITTDWKDLENVCMIAQLLQKRGMEKVVCVSSAKVPIVKIWDPELGLACDMNVNNTLALENTRMVLTYVEIDERVRTLAMIVKHWTRRRTINDAAFGGTLSSYTWICMIIAFLQLRDPPILPALHQNPHKKQTSKDGQPSEFADDLTKLRGYGAKNKETLGELLFHFFRFYAHEFDFDKSVISVRLGKLISKDEKGWTYTLNNMLCVEEPFNTIRNLGNTADDTSFRGLHLELRRAFDLIAEAKLDECCEQFVFPKEEERVWQKPAAAPRPVLVRSSSQQHSNRGGRGNYRGSRNHRGNNRRASSSIAYENNPAMPQAQGQAAFQPTLMQDGQWYATMGQAQYQYVTSDGFVNPIYGTTAIPIDQNTFRLQQLYSQHWVAAQQQAMNMANMQQRMSSSSNQPTDRSRAGSFDQPPLSAPLRPELNYVWPQYAMPGQFYQSPVSAYPSSPATTTTAATGGSEFRRSLHRNTVTGESGGASSSSTLRSQSQPASRSSLSINTHVGAGGQPSSQMAQGAAPAATASNGVQAYVNGLTPLQTSNGNGQHLNFVQNEEVIDTDFEGKSSSDSPPPITEDGHTGYVGYYLNDGSNPIKKPMPSGVQSSIPNGAPSFGDMSQNTFARRRLSSDHQSPQSILDRRMKRTSRSPSPLGHARAFSVGTTAPASAGTTPTLQNGNTSKLSIEAKPVVVNGSASHSTLSSGSSRQPSATESITSETPSFETPNYVPQTSFGSNGYMASDKVLSNSSASSQASAAPSDRPLVVNGSSTPSSSVAPPVMVPDSKSFNQRIAAMGTFSQSPTAYHRIIPNPAVAAQFSQLSPAGRFHNMHRAQQNGVIAPLDLAMPEHSMPMPDFTHLSPVYETRTPSPTMTRKFDGPASSQGLLASVVQNNARSTQHAEGSKPKQRSSANVKHENAKPNGHTNGHGPASPTRDRVVPRVEAAISPTSGQASDWQKTKSRKKPSLVNSTPHTGSGAEQPPKNDADRKGG